MFMVSNKVFSTFHLSTIFTNKDNWFDLIKKSPHFIQWGRPSPEVEVFMMNDGQNKIYTYLNLLLRLLKLYTVGWLYNVSQKAKLNVSKSATQSYFIEGKVLDLRGRPNGVNEALGLIQIQTETVVIATR